MNFYHYGDIEESAVGEMVLFSKNIYLLSQMET